MHVPTTKEHFFPFNRGPLGQDKKCASVNTVPYRQTSDTLTASGAKVVVGAAALAASSALEAVPASVEASSPFPQQSWRPHPPCQPQKRQGRSCHPQQPWQP
eukprot:GHVS01061654.1.p1 GENE.GHVS01061654.1~~GHVS01061654.1.p1  ORF type:complete len:102 (+),score=9.77 GHVS01061654.1:65-370(+)